ncbi:MAG: hypothetical protein ACOH2V_00080 [Candidatus Saccharimonadaceae bacterium]
MTSKKATIEPLKTLPLKSDIGNTLADVGTKISQLGTSFGGNILGEAVNVISPTAAD